MKWVKHLKSFEIKITANEEHLHKSQIIYVESPKVYGKVITVFFFVAATDFMTFVNIHNRLTYQEKLCLWYFCLFVRLTVFLFDQF